MSFSQVSGELKTGVDIGRIGLYAFLVIAAVYFVLPLAIMVSTSLKPMEEITSGSIFKLPSAPTFYAWQKAWSSACTGQNCTGIRVGFWNSVRILLPSLFTSVLLGAIVGFALAQWRVRGAGLLMGMLLLGAFIPMQVILYPLVKIFAFIGLYNTLPGIWVVHTIYGLPIMTLIFRNFFAGLPEELIKAARIDGAGFFRIFFQIMLPMSRNVLIVALVLQGTGIWSDYLLGLIIGGAENQPMTVQLNNIVNSQFGEVEYNVNMAATLLTALPPLILYFASGRYFVSGITAGAVKG
jgi:glucose/mannose transport system permease protein